MTNHERAAIAHYQQYKNSTCYNLEQTYGSYSSAKAQAWKYCRDLQYKKQGSWLKIISYNTFIYCWF